jgi:hypothetical protein
MAFAQHMAMSELEIRAILREALNELDRRAGRVVRKVVLPSMIGASLALGAGGCGQRAVQPSEDGSVADTGAVYDDSGRKKVDMGFLPSYMAPPIDQGSDIIPPAQPDYMAPLYMAPGPESDGGK